MRKRYEECQKTCGTVYFLPVYPLFIPLGWVRDGMATHRARKYTGPSKPLPSDVRTTTRWSKFISHRVRAVRAPTVPRNTRNYHSKMIWRLKRADDHLFPEMHAGCVHSMTVRIREKNQTSHVMCRAAQQDPEYLGLAIPQLRAASAIQE